MPGYEQHCEQTFNQPRWIIDHFKRLLDKCIHCHVTTVYLIAISQMRAVQPVAPLWFSKLTIRC